MVVWFYLFNAKLSPERYCWDRGIQEGGGGVSRYGTRVADKQSLILASEVLVCGH